MKLRYVGDGVDADPFRFAMKRNGPCKEYIVQVQSSPIQSSLVQCTVGTYAGMMNDQNRTSSVEGAFGATNEEICTTATDSLFRHSITDSLCSTLHSGKCCPGRSIVVLSFLGLAPLAK